MQSWLIGSALAGLALCLAPVVLILFGRWHEVWGRRSTITVHCQRRPLGLSLLLPDAPQQQHRGTVLVACAGIYSDSSPGITYPANEADH